MVCVGRLHWVVTDLYTLSFFDTLIPIFFYEFSYIIIFSIFTLYISLYTYIYIYILIILGLILE